MSQRSKGKAPVRPGPTIQSEISILNAEQYGGDIEYLATQPASSSSGRGRSDMVPPPPTAGNKRRAADRDDDDDLEEEGEKKKRARGRPRLDTTDETAAERRRTQIRLAQRAYRNRKDAAISTLEDKVKDLEDTQDSMSKEFSKLYNLILSEGLLNSSSQSSQIRAAADKLLRISNATGQGGSSSLESSSESETASPARPVDTGRSKQSPTSAVMVSPGSGTHGSQTSISLEPDRRSNVVTTLSETLSASSIPQPPRTQQPVYEVITQATPNNASFPFFTVETPQSHFSTGSHVNLFPNTSTIIGLPTPSSYAYNERTFGRRLLRTTCERGLKLASSPSPPPQRFAEVFGFCLLFETKQDIIRRLATSLKRSHNESMATWKVTLNSMRNEGVSFLENRYGEGFWDDDKLPFFKESETVHLMGDAFGPHSQSQEDIDERTEARIRSVTANFEGEFLASDEVELFLIRRGINIPAQVDFVDAEIDFRQLEESDVTEISGSEAHASVDINPPDMSRMPQHDHSFHAQTTSWMNNMSMPNNMPDNFSMPPLPGGSSSQIMNIGNVISPFQQTDLYQGMAPFMPQDFNQMWEAPPPLWNKTKVTVNVGRLIEEMVTKSVCLGRTPGVRPRDVIRALKIATGMGSSVT